MARERETEAWRGASGTLYPYSIVKIGQQLDTAYGNYIFTKLNAAGEWVAVYIGHGELSLRTDLDRHEMRDFLRRRGATHVHIHENSSLTDRMIERSDLLESHPEAGILSRFTPSMSA